MRLLQQILPLMSCSLQVVTSIPYSEYILAPDTRNLHPTSVYKVNGTVIGAESLTGTSSGNATFQGISSVTFDYGKNIAGVVSITVGDSSSADAFIGLTYTESSIWISSQGSDATGDTVLDEVLWLHVGKGPGTYTVEREHERGAFRYLSLVSNTSALVEITGISTYFTAAPTQDLRGYKGYFHSNDELLNRIWYAGAYTNQLGTIDPKHGNSLVHLFDNPYPNTGTLTWYNNFTISQGSSCITDGAKRDRLVWAGDLAIAVPSIVVSTNDLDSVKNGLDSLLVLQNPDTGLLPYAGAPFNQLGIVSFTYHLYSLIGISYYYKYTGDIDYLKSVWNRFTKGLQWSLNTIDNSGLMDVTSSADWLRFGMGGHNIEANSILYYTINEGINLAAILDDKSWIADWSAKATAIKEAANRLLWDESINLYKDNENSAIYPQDGNSWAIKSNLTLSSSQKLAISQALKARWGPYGAPAPEAGPTISPFISSFELESHFLASTPQNALSLMRLQWGFMLDDPRMTNSTFIEGYSIDGSLHYAPYQNDARVSHAHGWATGPTSLLSFYVAGIHLTSSIGKTWEISPMVGDLTIVEAGFETPLGTFSNSLKAENGKVVQMSFSTPRGSKGDVKLPGISGELINSSGKKVQLNSGQANGVDGGDWTLKAR